MKKESIPSPRARMVKEFGGMEGIADRGLLETAVTMPAAAFSGEFGHQSLPAMAAAHFFHIHGNRPFLHGNKRTAVVDAELFLNGNGMRLDAEDGELEQLCLGTAAGEIFEGEAVACFQERARDR